MPTQAHEDLKVLAAEWLEHNFPNTVIKKERAVRMPKICKRGNFWFYVHSKKPIFSKEEVQTKYKKQLDSAKHDFEITEKEPALKIETSKRIFEDGYTTLVVFTELFRCKRVIQPYVKFYSSIYRDNLNIRPDVFEETNRIAVECGMCDKSKFELFARLSISSYHLNYKRQLLKYQDGKFEKVAML